MGKNGLTWMKLDVSLDNLERVQFVQKLTK